MYIFTYRIIQVVYIYIYVYNQLHKIKTSSPTHVFVYQPLSVYIATPLHQEIPLSWEIIIPINKKKRK